MAVEETTRLMALIHLLLLIKHKLLRHTCERRYHDYYNVELRRLPSTSMYKVHEGVGGSEGPRII